MTDLEFVAMQNSTAVRSPGLPLAARLVRPAFAALSVRAPEPRSSIVAFLTAIQAIDRTLGPVRGVVAHSIGTVATARALYEGLGADAAVFIAPPADLVLQAHTILEALGFGRRARELMQERIERRLGRAWSALDVRGYAPAMRAPLLVVHDRDDAGVPSQDGVIPARTWPGAVFSSPG